MKIKILDSFTTDQGQTAFWEGVDAAGDVEVFPRTSQDEVLTRSYGAGAVLINKVMFDRDVIESLPDLRYIGLTSTGTNAVDLEAAQEKGIVVTHVPAYSTPSVAQLVFAFILQGANNVKKHHEMVREGHWKGDFCFFAQDITELAGKKIAVIGMGDIGNEVAQIAKAFRMEVIPVRRRTSLYDAIKNADFISLHCPLTEETAKMVDSAFLSECKSSAILINTARGGLIDEDALLKVVQNERIARVYLDVLHAEPPASDHPFFKESRIVLTPHIGWGSLEARQRLVEKVTENVKAFVAGESLNRVF
ncbi:MAG: NAD(P)-dependent oxidoreductase [Alphaproteobacteria bacterium]